MKPRIVPAAEVCPALGIRLGTVRVWKHRGILTDHGHDEHGRVLVDYAELWRVAKLGRSRPVT